MQVATKVGTPSLMGVWHSDWVSTGKVVFWCMWYSTPGWYSQLWAQLCQPLL